MTNQKKMPDFVLNKAKAEIETAKTEWEQAKKRIDSKYHDFLVLLPQNVNIFKEAYELTNDEKKLGIWCKRDKSNDKNNATFVSINKPYMTVDGRIRMARDEHSAAGKKLHISAPEIIEYGGKGILSVSVDSEIHGQAVGTIEIGDKSAVDKSFPISNAQTSALGRALSFLGYGLVGTGTVASAEEMTKVNQEIDPPVTQPEKQTSNAPKQHRVKAIEDAQSKPDGTSTVKVLTTDRKTVTLIIPKQMKVFAGGVKEEMILVCNGWLNGNVLRLANGAEPTIEKAS